MVKNERCRGIATKMIIAATGHRPDKLWGYDLKNPNYKILHDKIVATLKEHDVTHCISGMALGVDTVFAIAVINLKKEIPNIILECAIPCLNHDSQWQAESRKMYANILNKAEIVTQVSNEKYNPWLMQKRNEYMVDKCDKLLAVWNGTTGGTHNCIKYAKSKGKEIILLNPV
jgi:uncharacterized phage-like protein YoqJ